MRNIHVLYDTSVLGMAQLSGHRTGFARATEELARALGRLPGCDLRLVATDFQDAAQTYAREVIPGLPFAHPAWQTTASRLLYRWVYREKFMSDKSRGRPVAKRAAQLAIKAVLAPVRPALRRLDADTLRRADVYHAPSGQVPAQITRATAQRPGDRPLPIFVTVHDILPLVHPEFFPAATASQRQTLLNSFTGDRWYLCSSENTRRDLLATGRCDPARVFHTPLAASEAYFPRPEDGPAVRAKYGLGDAPYFLSVCTLEPRKNLATVIRAFLRLVSQRRDRLPADLKLVLVGVAGWMNETIQQASAEAGEDRQRIVLTGHVPEADLPGLYGQALAFVYLSFYEGFGLPVLEAMQCGLPVLSSNTSSLPEVVGDAGLQQDPRDEDLLLQNMLTLCQDAALRADLSRRALARAATFSWVRCAEKTLNAYRVAIGASGG